MFWRKNKETKLNSDEYESVVKKLISFTEKIETLEVRIKTLTTDVENLRGQFNRKLNKIKKEELQEETPQEQNINNPVILPYDGALFKNR